MVWNGLETVEGTFEMITVIVSLRGKNSASVILGGRRRLPIFILVDPGRSGIPDRFYFCFGPKFVILMNLQEQLQLNSVPTDQIKLSRSGIPNHPLGPITVWWSEHPILEIYSECDRMRETLIARFRWPYLRFKLISFTLLDPKSRSTGFIRPLALYLNHN